MLHWAGLLQEKQLTSSDCGYQKPPTPVLAGSHSKNDLMARPSRDPDKAD